MTNSTDIIKYTGGELLETQDAVIKEHRANIFVNGEPYVSLMCLPQFFEELAVGFLYSEQVINSYEDILEIQSTCTGNVFVDVKAKDIKKSKNRVIVSGCAQGSVNMSFLNEENLMEITSPVKVNPQDIIKMMSDFSRQSPLFKDTGGVHSSVLVLPEDCGDGFQGSLFFEDIGRHNAIDKIVGKALINGISVSDGILLTSGRISSEILIKTAKLNIPVLVSHSAPTEMAVEIARRVNMTLIGFARGKRFNVYSGGARVNLEAEY